MLHQMLFVNNKKIHLNHKQLDDHKKATLSDEIRLSCCPACGYNIAINFYNGGQQPLSILAWPKNTEEAKSLERLPLSFVRCVDCGHVYNADFDYSKVPYDKKPEANLMFNRGKLWDDHIQHIQEHILEHLPDSPTVIEIGCGDGDLLQRLAKVRPEGYYIGFDPNGQMESNGTNLEAQTILFDPAIHLAQYKPDLILIRHVLEHLKNPLELIQSIAFAATWEGLETKLYIEVPCIDRVFPCGRTFDFFYEHNSHFTKSSFTRLLSRCPSQIELIGRAYDEEIIYGFAKVGGKLEQSLFAQEAIDFNQKTSTKESNIKKQLEDLLRSGQSVAIWGGTGKAAMFINYFGMDAVRFPIVVDSDKDKVGTFVPGAGQEIRFRDYLKDHPVNTLIIAPQWRSRDIVLEIKQNNIPYQNILIEHNGRLINYFSDPHPYK